MTSKRKILTKKKILYKKHQKGKRPKDYVDLPRVAKVKEKLIEALYRNKGLVTYACQEVGVNRSVFYKYYRDDPDIVTSLQQAREYCLDFSERKLFELIEEKDSASVRFHLRCIGKHRGYFEKSELTIEDTEKQTIKIGKDKIDF